MDFDKESFLAGLAVGRAMWQPSVMEDNNYLNQINQTQPDDTDNTEDENDV